MKCHLLCGIFLCLYTIVHTEKEYAPIVQLKSGKIRGIAQNAINDKVYFYQGIRYGNIFLNFCFLQ